MCLVNSSSMNSTITYSSIIIWMRIDSFLCVQSWKHNVIYQEYDSATNHEGISAPFFNQNGRMCSNLNWKRLVGWSWGRSGEVGVRDAQGLSKRCEDIMAPEARWLSEGHFQETWSRRSRLRPAHSLPRLKVKNWAHVGCKGSGKLRNSCEHRSWPQCRLWFGQL